MSDVSQGPGWWQATDGKWYPPEQNPQLPPSPREAAAARRHRKRITALLVVLALALVVLVMMVKANNDAKDQAKNDMCEQFGICE